MTRRRSGVSRPPGHTTAADSNPDSPLPHTHDTTTRAVRPGPSPQSNVIRTPHANRVSAEPPGAASTPSPHRSGDLEPADSGYYGFAVSTRDHQIGSTRHSSHQTQRLNGSPTLMSSSALPRLKSSKKATRLSIPSAQISSALLKLETLTLRGQSFPKSACYSCQKMERLW